MGRNTKMVAYGLAGIALALAMSLGAFALAGSTLSHPPPTVRIVGVTQTEPHPSAGAWVPSFSPDPHPATSAPTHSASPDDHGGGTTEPTPSGGDDGSGPDGDHDDD